MENPVQPGDAFFQGHHLFFSLGPADPPAVVSQATFFFFFELPLGIEHSLLEKILGSVTHKEFTLIVSNNRLMSTGSTKKWKDPDQGAIQGRPPSLS